MNIFNLCLLFTVVLFSCSNTSSKRGKNINYDFNNPQQIIITNKLTEISDIANSNDGSIFAIGDEIGIIYKLDPKNGKIIKRFFLGKWTAEADFEGIAVTDKYLYAIASNGSLYKFEEGENNSAVNYEVENLPFSSKFDIEGLYYDKELNGLLILPKEYGGKKYKQQRVIYFYSLERKQIENQPVIQISLKTLKEEYKIRDFYPSGITKHPITGNYFIISAKGQNVVVEIDKTGNIIGTQKLKESIHRQPEGITILQDNTLIISDEADGKKPMITRYNYLK